MKRTLEAPDALPDPQVALKSKLFDTSITPGTQQAVDFITNILESSTEYSIIAKDLEGKILLWNEGARRLYGYEPEEVVGKLNSAILHVPDDVAPGKPQEILTAALVRGKWEGTISRRRKNGEEFTARVVITPRRSPSGEPIGFLLISKDTSEEMRTSQYARSLIEASLDPLVTISADGKITDVNEATIKVTGVSREKMIGTDFSNYFTEPEKAREGYQQVFAKGFVTDYPLTIRHRAGKLVDVLYNASVYKDMRGNVLGVFAAARDVTAQKQASQYARSLIEASLDPLVTISPDGKITDVNEATIKVTGASRDELVGTDFSNYFTEPEQAREGYQQVFAKGFVTDYPLTIRHRGGKLIDVLYNASVYKDVGGNVLGVFAAARDITESKRVMAEFTDTKNFLDNILQSSIKYSIIGKDLERRILSWNEGAHRNYGYAAEEILGKNSMVLHTPEDVESGAVEKLMATAADKGLAEGEFERVRKDGSRFTGYVVVTVRKDVSGKPIGYLVMSNDISEKRQAEEELRRASQYARSLIEASLDPLVTISPDGKITDVNEATTNVTGRPREQLIGTDFSNYFSEPEKAREGYQQVFAKGMVTDYPLTIRHLAGRLTSVLYNAALYRDDRGNVLGVFAAARDVTGQKRAEEQIAEQRAKELERLAELERFQKLTVGRELKMIELKKQIAELESKVVSPTAR